MRRLGQHFLKDEHAITKIVAAVTPPYEGVVIEIGPGHGELTLPLHDACVTARCGKMISIERDASLASALQAQFAHDPLLEIKTGDALFALPQIVGEEIAAAGNHPYTIAGNIPYYITGHLLRIIGELRPLPQRTVLLIQKEVAERIAAVPPHMNRLAASVQFWADPKIIASVPRQHFSPPPEVDSAVIVLASRPLETQENTAQYYAAVRALFAQPRKTILNNLAAGLHEKGNGGGKKLAPAEVKKTGIDPSARPQDLSPAEIRTLAARFF